MERHLETMTQKLNNKLDHNIRGIKNSQDLSRIKLLEKIAKLEILIQEGISSACGSLKVTLDRKIDSKAFILSRVKTSPK